MAGMDAELSEADLLTSLIPSYPDLDDPGVIKQITQRKEFYDVRLSREDKAPEAPGELLKQQLFLSRFISGRTQYPSTLLFQDVGTGKTCGAGAVVEHYKQFPLEEGRRRRPPALVFVRNSVLRQNFKNQVATVCTDDIYLPKLTEKEERLEEEMDDKRYQTRLTRAISRSYRIVTYDAFFNTLKGTNDKIIKENYSNRVIILDEAHHLRVQPHKGKKEKSLYDHMHHFLHTVENCRVLLLTATPIWDKAFEIASLMNLITPETNQINTGKDGKEFNKLYFDEDNKLKDTEPLRNAWRGRISYLRSTAATATRIEKGVTRPWTQRVIVYPDALGEFQLSVYQEASERETEAEKQAQALQKFQREAINFVFQDRTYGIDGFNKHVTLKHGRWDLDGETKTALGRKYKNLKKFSTKMYAIIKDIHDHPGELVFVYTEFVRGSGALLFGVLLRYFLGFEWIREGRPRSKKDRFAVITSEPTTTSTPTQIRDLLRTFNDPKNRTGDIIRVIVGSEKIAEGVTLKNVRRVHVLMPHWNLPGIDQAIGRAIRFGSHTDLPEQDRTVTIFRHAAVDQEETIMTADVNIYRLAERKDWRAAQIYRMLKEISIDCALNYQRNVLPTDKPKSRECNYNPDCNYVCDGMDPVTGEGAVWTYPVEEINKETYNLFYAAPEVQDTKRAIVNLFGSVYFALDINMVAELVQTRDRHVLAQALSQVIDERIPIRDRYGFVTYLNESGSVYFLDDTLGRASTYEESVYVERPLMIEKMSMEESTERQELMRDREAVCTFVKEPTPANLEKVSYKGRIILLEEVLRMKEQKEIRTADRPVVDAIETALGTNVYTMEDGSRIHILYTQEFAGLSYTVTAKALKVSGSMRIYDPQAKQWTYVNDPDIEKGYLQTLKTILKERKDVIKGYYGSVSAGDGKFRIHAPGRGRGFVCENAKADQVIDAFLEVEYYPKVDEGVRSLTREDVVQRLIGLGPGKGYSEAHLETVIQEKSLEQLQSLLTLFAMKKTRRCELLKKWFEENNKLHSV